MFQINVVEKINTHFLCSVNFFFIENHVLDELMLKNVIVPGRPQMTIWGMSIACCIPKATNTHTQNMEYLLLFQGNNGYTKAPECYVICRLLVLLNIFLFKDLNPGDKNFCHHGRTQLLTSKEKYA